MKATRIPNPRWATIAPEVRPGNGVQMHRLFKLEPPLKWRAWGDDEASLERIEYILVSDSIVPAFFVGKARPETMTFRSTEQGEWVNGENLSEVVGEFNHIEALEQLGVIEIIDTIGD